MSEKTAIKAVAFDLDGTLVDSAPDLALAINLMLTELGRATFSVDVIHQWVGNGAELLVKRALSGKVEVSPEIDEAFYLKARAIFDRCYGENLCVGTQVYDGVKELLQWLQSQSIAMAVITNKPFEFTGPLLEQLGLADYFDLILGGDSLPKRKPDPMPLEHVLAHRHLTPAQMLMVGDSRNDILAAKAAGCPCLGLTYGYNYGVPIAQSEPDWVSEHISLVQSIVTASV